MGSVSGFNGIILKQLCFFQLSISFDQWESRNVTNISIIPDKLSSTFRAALQYHQDHKYLHPTCINIFGETWNIPSGDPHSWWIHTHICHTNERNTRTPSNNKKSVTCQTPLLVVFRYISFSNNWSQGILAIMPSCIVRRTLFSFLFFLFRKCFAM